MQTGYISRLNLDRGFGFLTRDDDGKQLFFHCKSLDVDLEFTEQLIERRVRFRIGEHNGNPCAVDIQAAS